MTRFVLLLTAGVLIQSPVYAQAGFDLAARKQRLPWIWEPPHRQIPPEIESAPSASEVDRFILARLHLEGISPSPPANDLTWLRRVSFALSGLPPERSLMQAFQADASPEGRRRVVDDLLASTHFGERWARHWMDLVRYAESRGHEEDFLIANAWRYRDYLVRTINADVPYDRFVAEHVAGDLLAPRLDPASGANESVVATGWAFLGEENHSPVDIRLDECERVDNKIDVLTKTFLGLTVACARCHDHKFDAITQRDYYALAGFVVSSPFRQVRFETMEAHARAASTLEQWRSEEVGKITAALADSARPGVAALAAHLNAARQSLHGESTKTDAGGALDEARLRAWREHLQQASVEPEHPLHQLGRVAMATAFEEFAVLASVLGAGTGTTFGLPIDALVIADFTRPGATPWRTDGPSFGTRPMAAGELVIGTSARPVARILTAGAAAREPFWNRLSLAPGTEMDAGSLAAAARAGRTLRSPKFTLKSGRLHYLIRGQAQVYAGVDSHLMITGPLHGALVTTFDTGGRTAWVTHNLQAYAGHRAHLEFSPKDDAGLEVLMAVDAQEPPTWRPEESWTPALRVATWSEMAAAFQAECFMVVEALASGELPLPPRVASLANWFALHPVLTGASEPAVAASAATLLRRRDDLARTIRWESATAVSWADGSGVDEPILLRGKPTTPGAVAHRGLPEAFGQPRITTPGSSGRAELARQMTDPSNPLTARVMVNRIWHHLFGRGLVPTVDNFGFLGDRPTHPELLDHLAWQFVHEDGWSIKRMIRRLILTDTFGRSSRVGDRRAEELDPANLLLHRMPVRRLEGEAIRDALLTVSGRLDRTLGGPPVPLHLTEFTVGRGSPASGGPLDGAGRRSLYIAARRNFLPTMMLAFDLPIPFSTVGRRNVTNVPAQALTMMNDPFVREQAEVWAARMRRELPDGNTPARIAWLFATAFGRPPTADETAAALGSLDELRALQAGASDESVWSELCHALLGTNDFIHVK